MYVTTEYQGYMYVTTEYQGYMYVTMEYQGYMYVTTFPKAGFYFTSPSKISFKNIQDQDRKFVHTLSNYFELADKLVFLLLMK